MCAIVDVNAFHELFGLERSEAGVRFFQWINGGSGRLVAGGKLLEELSQTRSVQKWAQQAILSGRMKLEDKGKVDTQVTKLKNVGSYKSNDPHVLALAQISGARLLYSNDTDLQQDFKNGTLINGPRGKVYSTREGRSFRDSHKKLLRRRDLCSKETKYKY